MTTPASCRRTAWFAVAIAIMLAMCGCNPERLLRFKNQLKNPESAVTIVRGERTEFKFLQPVLQPADLNGLGLAPASIENVDSHHAVWHFDFRSSRPGIRPILLELHFTDNVLTSVAMENDFATLLREEIMLNLMRSVGAARLDFIKRKLVFSDDNRELGLTSFPSRPQVEKVFGPPQKLTALPESRTLQSRVYKLSNARLRATLRLDVAFKNSFDTFKGCRIGVFGFEITFTDAGFEVQQL